MDKRIAEQIDAAMGGPVKRLDLSSFWTRGEKLTVIPDEVFELTQLEELSLSGNAIEGVPDRIGNLQALRYLDLSSNQIAHLPNAISGLTELTALTLVGNPLNVLPDWIPTLPRLSELHIGSHPFTSVPGWLSQMINLTKLGLSNLHPLPEYLAEWVQLESLSLAGSNLKQLPEWLFRVGSLTELDLNANQLAELPPSIVRLRSLEKLHLWVNRLDNLPDNFGDLERLQELNLAGNLLSDLPPSFRTLRNLTALYLGNNNLARFPECLYEMPALEILTFGNADSWAWNFETKEGRFEGRNTFKQLSPKLLKLGKLRTLEMSPLPLETPPPEVVERGLTAIQDYFRQIDSEGVDYLFEAKLLILGEGGAGKTTLAKKIQNSGYLLEEEKSTQGIDIIRWTFPLENGREFRVNIWDFGGQEIYHATHQFFLTKRSLYVLVADTRKEDTDFYYWLNILELLSDNSPVLIVKNEKQDRHREISERQLRGQFAALKETLPANLATNRGLPEILKSVKYYISNLQHVGSPLPRTWVKVREVLERHPSNYIPADEYFDICEKNGFSDLKTKLQLSGYLHDLGVCLHFQEDPILKDVVILKPSWGTDAVYKILDNKKVISALGRFTQADLANIWSEPEYQDMQQELLRLMINFKLCYEIPGSAGSYIAPQLLTENQPPYEWDVADNLVAKYRYEFMPKGIVTQFTVAMHPLIGNRGMVWKSGVILEKDSTKAEIIENYAKREIQVRIAGKQKRDLMTVVTYELDKIHSSYRQLNFSRLVPCNCERCRLESQPMFFSQETLRKFMGDRQEQIQCQLSYQMVEVRGLLDDAIDPRPVGKEVGRGSVVFNAPINRVVIQQAEAGGIQNTEAGGADMEGHGHQKIKSAWANGSFYLFAFLVIVAGLGYLAGHLPLYALGVVIIAGVVATLVVGALQLRQDDRLSEKSFMQLVQIVIRQLPIIERLTRSGIKGGP